MKFKKALSTLVVALAISVPALAGCNKTGGSNKEPDSGEVNPELDKSYAIAMSGNAVTGEKISFILNKDGSPVVSGFTFEGKTSADAECLKFDEDGFTAECIKEGNITVVAKVGGKVVAELAVTITKLEISAIKDAMDDAIKAIPFNGKSGASSAKTEKIYTVQGKVVAVPLTKTAGKYDGTVLIDDGTEILPLLVYGDAANMTVNEGDSVQTTIKFTNYYGVLEGIATVSTAEKQNSLFPDQLKVINKAFSTKKAENMTAEGFAAYYATAKANGATGSTTYTSIKHVNLKNVLGNGGTGADKKMLMPGDTSECNGLIAITDTTSCTTDVTAEKATNVTGYMVGGNSSSKYLKMTVLGQEDPKAESVSIESATGSFMVAPGAQLTLTPNFAPAGSTASVKWYSLNEEVATVDENTGVVTGVSNGFTAIRCVPEGSLFPAFVMIEVDNNPCVKVEIKDANNALVRNLELLNLEGQTAKLNAVRTGKNPNKDCGDTLVWASSNENVVTVSAAGLVTAVGTGTATITATAGNASAEVAVVVRDQTLADLGHAKVGDVVDTYGIYVGDWVKSGQAGYWIADGEYGAYVYAKPSTIEGEVADGAIIHVVGTVGNYNGGKQIAPTSAEVVAEYDGLATPKALSITANTVYDETMQGRYVTVAAKVTSRDSVPAYNSKNVKYVLTIAEGKTLNVYLNKNYTTEARYNDFADKALVGRNVVIGGYMSANKSGATDFAALDASAYQIINPEVISYETINPTGITLDKTTAEVEQGKTLALTATVTPEGAEGTVAWSVEGNDKVTVSADGLVSVANDATVGSTATIKATVASFTASCTITVKAKPSGQLTEILSLDYESITAAGTGSSGYAKYNGSRTIGGYTVESNQVMPGKQGSIDCIQFQKTNGKLTIKNIVCKRVKVIGITTYTNTEAKYLPSFEFGSQTKTFTDPEAAAIFGAQVDTGEVASSKAIYSFVVEYDFNGTTAADLVINGNPSTGGAFYATQIIVY